MSGLLALLDDVAAIAKVAAASVDDIAAATAKAGTKAAGIVIDDAAVTPKYVAGLAPARELPIIWKITKGSLRNKLVILLPLALLLNSFAPWLISPLLMLGGAYLCFEGAEKVLHWIIPHGEAADSEETGLSPANIEDRRVSSAISTDFILSAEIMAIALSTIADVPLWQEAVALAVVAVGVTFLVYGSVGLIVKMDDIGLHMVRTGRTGAGRAFGRGLVRFMPVLMQILSFVGTLAMLWVGGSIIVHGMHQLGLHWPYSPIAEIAASLSQGHGFINWLVTATLDGIFGLVVGMLVIPLVQYVISPLWGWGKGLIRG